MNKLSARIHFKALRAAFTPINLEENSQKIAMLFLQQFDLINIQCVHTFLPIAHLKEVDTTIIIHALHALYPKLQIAVPKIDKEFQDLHSVLWSPNSEFILGTMKIPEPKDAIMVNSFSIDMVLIPLLAFDAAGHRVGYGKGFYDKFLAACKPNVVKIGLCFFDPIQKISDIGSHDVALDFCITPEKIYEFSKV